MSVTVGIECVHMDIDQQPDNEHAMAMRRLAAVEEEFIRDGAQTSHSVLIDDYSRALSFHGLDDHALLASLADVGARPDVVVSASACVEYCDQTLAAVVDDILRRQMEREVELTGRYPAPLVIATWNLLRLGAFGEPPIACLRGTPDAIFVDRLMAILPDRRQTTETLAIEIVRATRFAHLADRIDHRFYFYVRSTYSPWSAFDPEEFGLRNYRREILSEDRRLVSACLQGLERLGVRPGDWDNVADIGTGPNLYPAMILAAHLRPGGRLALIDHPDQNVDYLDDLIEGRRDDHVADWRKYEELLVGYGGERYRGSLNRVLDTARVQHGSIYTLDPEQYDAVTAFFVAECITDRIDEFRSAMQCLIRAVKPGGLVIVGHIIGSRGHYAGEKTYFPGTFLTREDVESAYAGCSLEVVELADHEGVKAARQGYAGMSVVVAVRTASPPSVTLRSNVSSSRSVRSNAARTASLTTVRRPPRSN